MTRCSPSSPSSASRGANNSRSAKETSASRAHEVTSPCRCSRVGPVKPVWAAASAGSEITSALHLDGYGLAGAEGDQRVVAGVGEQRAELGAVGRDVGQAVGVRRGGDGHPRFAEAAQQRGGRIGLADG